MCHVTCVFVLWTETPKCFIWQISGSSVVIMKSVFFYSFCTVRESTVISNQNYENKLGLVRGISVACPSMHSLACMCAGSINMCSIVKPSAFTNWVINGTVEVLGKRPNWRWLSVEPLISTEQMLHLFANHATVCEPWSQTTNARFTRHQWHFAVYENRPPGHI